MDEAEYIRRYNAQLEELDPLRVLDDLNRLALPAREPVLRCWETVHAIRAGTTYCHRDLVAQWFGDRLGLEVLEL